MGKSKEKIKYCPKCGFENKEDSAFCGNCGYEFKKKSEKTKKNMGNILNELFKTKKRTLVTLFAIIIVVGTCLSIPTEKESPTTALSTTTAAPTTTAVPTTTPIPTTTVPPTTTPAPTTPVPTTVPPESQTVEVTEVIDGDTIDVLFSNGKEERVRMVGIDTPESHGEDKPGEFEGIDDTEHLKEWGYKAKDYTTERLLNKTVELKYDEIAGERGYYGRLLAYIIINGQNFNLELVRKGYARVYTEADCELMDELLVAQNYAQDHKIGLWDYQAAETPAPTTKPPTGLNVEITSAHYDAAGNDHKNLNDEYFTITNNGSSTVDFTGWKVKDEANHTFFFPSGFTLSPSTSVTIYTGSGTNTSSKLYWGSGSAIWNNDGDTIYLYNSSGELVDTYSW